MEDYIKKCDSCPLKRVNEDGNFVCTLTGKLCRDMSECPEELDQ